MTSGPSGPAVPLIRPLGESAVLIEITGSRATERAAALAARLQTAPPVGVLDAVAAYETLAVYFDPLICDSARITSDLAHAATEVRDSESAAKAAHVVPVVYDGEDLAAVAEHTGLAPSRIAEIHSSVEYSVLAVGFVPGFAYLGELDERIRVPRRDTPRTRVPAGAVAIAGPHTAVYPLATPGGWHLIGRTTIRMFEATRSPPALLSAGDRVRFVPE